MPTHVIADRSIKDSTSRILVGACFGSYFSNKKGGEDLSKA